VTGAAIYEGSKPRTVKIHIRLWPFSCTRVKFPNLYQVAKVLQRSNGLKHGTHLTQLSGAKSW